MNSTTVSRIGFRALKAVIIYAVVWAIVFTVCFLINKAVGDATTANILQVVKYAGYPLLAIGWVLGWIVAGFVWVLATVALGAVWILKATFPYCLYFGGIPLSFFVLYKIAMHLAANPGPTAEERAAEARHQERMRAVKEAMLLKSLSEMTRD